MTDESQLLLTELLALVQDLHTTIQELKQENVNIKTELANIKRGIDDTINSGFVDRDLLKHKEWHDKHNKGFFKRIFG